MQKRIFSSFSVSIVLAAALLALPLAAWSAAGKVLFVSGEVFVSSPKQPGSKLVRGNEINSGDLIKTGATGFAQIAMDDGGRLTLRANSQLKINEFTYTKQRTGLSLMSLLEGSMRAVTGWIGHNNRNHYKIKTPTATIGIRGSDGNIGYSLALGSAVQTLEGGHTLTYFDANGEAHSLDLNPGEVGLLPPNATQPVKVKDFPFPVTQPLGAATKPKKSGSDASLLRPTPGPENTQKDNRLPTENQPGNTPTLNDAGGGIIGIDANGQRELVPPPQNQRQAY